MSLSRQDVAKVGLLARLALTEPELERMTGELSKIVDFVSQLGELDTDRPCLTTAEALANAPRHDGSCFLVPAVLGESGAA